MTSLLTSIFGEKATKTKRKSKAAADLFAHPVTVPPPPAANNKRAVPTEEEEDSKPKEESTKKQKRDKKKEKKQKAVVQEEEKEEPQPALQKDDEKERQEESPEPDEETADKVETTDTNNDEKTVFVGNLPVSTTRKDLARLFRSCGKIASTRIRSVATLADEAVKLPAHQAGNQKLVRQILVNQKKVDTTSKPTVQGYVVFENVESVEKALELNNTPVPVKSSSDSSSATATTTPQGTEAPGPVRRMRVDRVSKEYDARRSVFIGNLPYHADEETLRACFVQHCQWKDEDIHGVRIVRDKDTHKCKGFGYLLMADTSMVSVALRSMDGVNYMGRPLRVRVCGKRFKSKSADDNQKGSEAGALSSSSSSSSPPLKSKATKPVAASLREMVKEEHAQKQDKRKRGSKKASAKSSGKSKRAAAQAKTKQRIKKIEKRIRKGMGKNRVR